jgi:topoisomerase IV subunit A
VLEEIEELTNPKVKAGKKALSAEQVQLKASMLAVLDAVRDESGKDAAVRLVFEPKTRTVEQHRTDHHAAVADQPGKQRAGEPDDGRPRRPADAEEPAPDAGGVGGLPPRDGAAPLAAPAGKVRDRIHVLEGRQLVLLNIDEVIRIIRKADEPKPALIARFALSDRQAEDILEIRLRQLARLEAIRIEQELKELREERPSSKRSSAAPAALKRTLIKEIEADAKVHGDERRTLIQADKRAVAEIKVVDEPVTVVVSLKGWVRALKGHEIDAATLQFKAGDALYGTFPCRSVDTLLVARLQRPRVYTVPVSAAAGRARRRQPITTLIDLEPARSRRTTSPARRRSGCCWPARRLRPAGAIGDLVRASAAARPS